MALVWHTAGAIFGCCLLVVFFGSHYITAKQHVTTWEKWQDITACTARPYNCTGYAEDDRVLGQVSGKLVQMRHCQSTRRLAICQFEDEIGALRETPCDNVNVCPGWSKWSDYAPCTLCSRQKNTLLLGTHVHLRECDNPAPIHKDVLCADIDLSPSLVEYEETECECDEAEEATTTEAPVETTTTEELPCCEDEDDYKMADINATMLNSTTTPDPVEDIDFKEAYKDYFDMRDKMYLDNCRKCNGTNGTTVDEPDELHVNEASVEEPDQ